MLQERSETRMLCADIVNVRWKDRAGHPRKSTAILEDISSSGACLQFDSPLQEGTMIRILYPKGYLEGTVKYCVFRDIGYFVGLQFTEGSRWNRREYQPQHLLDVNRLLARGIRSAARRLQQESVH
ncbi:MAG: PilZ domain-containing protein [Bryobacteraceae bacterium]